MKVLICSDTHQNISLFQRAIDHAQSLGCDTLWHLGDWYDDVQNAETYALVTHQVPGLWHPHYRSSAIPNLYSRSFGPVDATLVHDIGSLHHHISKKPQVLFNGHTHHPTVLVNSSNVSINPGHLKHPTDRGYMATYMISTITSSSTTFEMEISQFSHAQETLSSLTLRYQDNQFKITENSGSFYGKISL